MNARFLACCLILASAGFLLVDAHMVIEDRTVRNDSSPADVQEQRHADAPPILIVELKSVKKTRKPDKKALENKISDKTKRPPPPADCIPLWAGCKTANTVCCDHCSYCQCRFFKTVCYCRMGNSRC